MSSSQPELYIGLMSGTSMDGIDAALVAHPDWVEAMAFAWLAYQNIHQQTGNLPSVTGASKSVVLGKLINHTI